MTINRTASLASLFSILALSALPTEKLEAQSISRRVSSAPDGKVRMTFATRPDICGHGTSIGRGKNQRMSWGSDYSEDVEYTEFCSESPVRLVLEMRGGNVSKLRTYVGGRWRPASGVVTDLGNVSTRNATDYLLALASTDDGRVGREAIMPATLADSVVVWPGLLRIARDAGRPDQTRKQAVFWLGQAAGDVVTGNRAAIAAEGDGDTEIREQAVFALSQRRNGEAVPALIQVARANKSPKVRKTALFWLGQTADPRAITLFEEILTRR